MVVDTKPSTLHLITSRPRCGCFFNQIHSAIIRDALTANQSLHALIRRLQALSAQV